MKPVGAVLWSGFASAGQVEQCYAPENIGSADYLIRLNHFSSTDFFFSSTAQPRSKIATTGIVRLKLWKSLENLHVGADFTQGSRLSHLQERELWAEQLMHNWMKINEVTLHKLFKTMQQCNKVKGGPMKCKSPPTAPDNGKLAWLVTQTGSSGFVNFAQIHPVQSQTTIGVRSLTWITPVSGHNALARGVGGLQW